MGLAAAINAGFRIGAGPGAAINANSQRGLANQQTEFLSTRKRLAEKEIAQREQQIEFADEFLGRARSEAGQSLAEGDIASAVRRIEQAGQVARALEIPDAPELTFRQRLSGQIDGPSIGEVSPFGPFNAQAFAAGALPFADPLEAISGPPSQGPTEGDVLAEVARRLEGSALNRDDEEILRQLQGFPDDPALEPFVRRRRAVRLEELFREANDALSGIGSSAPAAPSAGFLDALNASAPVTPNFDGFTAEIDFEALLDERDVLNASIGRLTVERAREFATSRVDIR